MALGRVSRVAVRAEENGVEPRRPAATAQERPLRRRAATRRTGPGGLRRLVGLVLLVPAIGLVLVLALGLVYSAVTPPSTLMLGRWLTLQPVAREAVPLSGISPNLVQAVMTSEDQRFCLHHGVDLGALRDVVEDEEGPSRGASTIAMQTGMRAIPTPMRAPPTIDRIMP